MYVPPATARRVATQLAYLARVSCAVADELDQIAGRPLVTEETVERLERLLVEVRAAAGVRAELAATDPDLLLAGAAVAGECRPAAPHRGPGMPDPQVERLYLVAVTGPGGGRA